MMTGDGFGVQVVGAHGYEALVIEAKRSES